jgi:hypothetical protein
MGRKAGSSQAQERVTIAVERRDVERLCLHVDGIGTVCIGTMDTATSQSVFAALLKLTPTETRMELQEDTQLDLSDIDTWFYVLNEVARSGVKLSLSQERS